MKFRIHFEVKTDTGIVDDWIEIGGGEEQIEEIRGFAEREIEKRGGKNPWSEEIK